jgi:hypothetical protein
MPIQKCDFECEERITLRKYDAETGKLVEVINTLNGKILEVITDKEELKKWL